MPRLPETCGGFEVMLIMGQSNRIWHYFSGKFPDSVGVLIGPSYGTKVPIDDWMPFVLDNDAFTAWRDKKPFDLNAWLEMLIRVRDTKLTPLWAAVPDVVTNREETIKNWDRYSHHIKKLGWKTAFCVQDGMTPDDVPNDADVIFVGGSDAFKFPTLKIWTDNFPRVHCARVNATEMLETCCEFGCESVDGTGWFRDVSRFPRIRRFIEGHRNATPRMIDCLT